MKKLTTFTSIAALSVLLGRCTGVVKVTNFDECEKAGGKVMESSPRQCEVGGQTFTEETSAPSGTVGLANPASVNCKDKGGDLQIKKDGEGNEYGVCYFEDNRQCEEWALMRGECPVGGVKVTGYDNQGQMICAIRGGQVDMENEMCTLPDKMDCGIMETYIMCPDVTTPKDADTSTGANLIGMPNPASVNCSDKGGTLKMENKDDKGEYGVCYWGEDKACEEWALMRDECPEGGVDISKYKDNRVITYCAITGGEVLMLNQDEFSVDVKCKKAGVTCDVFDYYDNNGCSSDTAS